MHLKGRDVRYLKKHATFRDVPRLTLRLKDTVWPGQFARGLYPLVRHHTMLRYEALYSLWKAVRYVSARGIPGSVVECGVARGGSTAVLARTLSEQDPRRRVYCFDTFEGLPAPTNKDPDLDRASVWTGKCRGEQQEVDTLLRSLELNNYNLVKGLFQDTLPITDTGPISLLHIDGDWYESTRAVLENAWDRVVEGGIVQIDDYGGWQGCKRAVDEFFERKAIPLRLHYVDPTARLLRKY